LDKDPTSRQNGDIDKKSFAEDHESRKISVGKAPETARGQAKGSS
jgi:hypothetical protein